MGMIRSQERTREMAKLAGKDRGRFDDIDFEVSMAEPAKYPEYPDVVRFEITNLCGGVAFLDVSPMDGVVGSGWSQDPTVFVDWLGAEARPRNRR